MSFQAELIGELILTVIVLLWAVRSKLDLGWRTPDMRQAWPWTMLYAAWIIAERIALSLSPATEDIGWVRAVESLSPFQNILLMVVIGPLTEELLYRGALFSALMRRWGPWVAIIAPSILWALFHTQYGQWLIISIAVSGVVLGITRWKGGSIVVPLGLHVAGNLFDLALS